jgi:hypothetical protein
MISIFSRPILPGSNPEFSDKKIFRARSFRVGIAAENPQRPERKRKARGFAANSPTIRLAHYFIQEHQMVLANGTRQKKII